jgi:hypothetical protein
MHQLTVFSGVVLQMKAMNIDTIVNFPFPSPPDRQSLHNAEKVRPLRLRLGHVLIRIVVGLFTCHCPR